MIYGLLRIATEVFRQPDEGVELTFGLSRGQLLSLLMVVAGAIGLTIATRRKVPKMSGMLKPQSVPARPPQPAVIRS